MSPQVQSPWGRKPTARSEECQGGPCGWRRARGKEENREGTRRGGQRCVAAGLEDSAVPSEMEQGEVSTGQACQDLDSNKITAWGPGKSSGEAREELRGGQGGWRHKQGVVVGPTGPECRADGRAEPGVAGTSECVWRELHTQGPSGVCFGQCCFVSKSCPALCDSVDCSRPGFPVLHCLLEFAQTHVR